MPKPSDVIVHKAIHYVHDLQFSVLQHFTSHLVFSRVLNNRNICFRIFIADNVLYHIVFKVAVLTTY